MTDLLTGCFSIETIAIHFPGYPMSYLELAGTLFYLLSVWLIARKHMLTWPLGIVSVILFFFLFYQIRLYSDALEQVYYLGACIYGWWFWKTNASESDQSVSVSVSRPESLLFWAVITVVSTLILSRFMGQIHRIFPVLFPEPASLPFLDTFTTLMSFTAMFLMARKKTESWVYWIIVDCIGIWLYYEKNVKFLSILYVILLCIAVNGLVTWTRSLPDQDSQLKTEIS